MAQEPGKKQKAAQEQPASQATGDDDQLPPPLIVQQLVWYDVLRRAHLISDDDFDRVKQRLVP